MFPAEGSCHPIPTGFFGMNGSNCNTGFERGFSPFSRKA